MTAIGKDTPRPFAGCGSAQEPIRSTKDNVTKAGLALLSFPGEQQRVIQRKTDQPLDRVAKWQHSSSPNTICALCATLPLSLEICRIAGKPSRALRSHSLNLLLNSRTDFRYWILTSSRKSGSSVSSRLYRERSRPSDLACKGRGFQQVTQRWARSWQV